MEPDSRCDCSLHEVEISRCFREAKKRRRRMREKERKRGASSCRSVLRFDVGNHVPHSPSAAEIFGFIVCEGLSPNRGVSRTQGRKKRSRERRRARKTLRKEGEKGSTSRAKKEAEEGEEENRGWADGGKRGGKQRSCWQIHRPSPWKQTTQKLACIVPN